MKTCDVCGSSFPKRGRRLRCSDECSRAVKNARRRSAYEGVKHPVTGEDARPCRVCGFPLVGLPRQARYHTGECARAEGARRTAEYRARMVSA